MAVFQGNPGKPVPEPIQNFMEPKDDAGGAIRRAKLQYNCHNQQTNTQPSTGRMTFLSSNQQCQSTEWKVSHSTFAHLKLTWWSFNLFFDH